jgi:hypothetical protein
MLRSVLLIPFGFLVGFWVQPTWKAFVLIVLFLIIYTIDTLLIHKKNG